jgi:hypothetical protein
MESLILPTFKNKNEQRINCFEYDLQAIWNSCFNCRFDKDVLGQTAGFGVLMVLLFSFIFFRQMPLLKKVWFAIPAIVKIILNVFIVRVLLGAVNCSR